MEERDNDNGQNSRESYIREEVAPEGNPHQAQPGGDGCGGYQRNRLNWRRNHARWRKKPKGLRRVA
jgi:hypothetical protein